MKKHELKTWSEYFDAVWSGAKTCEVRVYDREYEVGDVLLLRDYDMRKHEYRGRELEALVTHIVGPPFAPAGLAVMSIRVLSRSPIE